uniref:Genome assembly, chromosome: II n=1 Tax=Panagrellus redivivus TaxID=6233 RepID=A0A7E4VF04_PANRE
MASGAVQVTDTNSSSGACEINYPVVEASPSGLVNDGAIPSDGATPCSQKMELSSTSGACEINSPVIEAPPAASSMTAPSRVMVPPPVPRRWNLAAPLEPARSNPVEEAPQATSSTETEPSIPSRTCESVTCLEEGSWRYKHPFFCDAGLSDHHRFLECLWIKPIGTVVIAKALAVGRNGRACNAEGAGVPYWSLPMQALNAALNSVKMVLLLHATTVRTYKAGCEMTKFPKCAWCSMVTSGITASSDSRLKGPGKCSKSNATVARGCSHGGAFGTVTVPKHQSASWKILQDLSGSALKSTLGQHALELCCVVRWLSW